MTQINRNARSTIFWGVCAIACLAYTLPWVANTNQTLDLNAYDLAEWLSLHPAAQQMPFRLPALALRGQLLILVALIAWQPKPTNRWLGMLCISLLIIAQLPPLDFVNNTGDLNQRQQFLLAVGSLISAGIGYSSVLRKHRSNIMILLSIIGIIGVGVSIQQVLTLMPAYGLETRLGVGAFLLLMCYFVLGILNFAVRRINTKEPPEDGS